MAKRDETEKSAQIARDLAVIRNPKAWDGTTLDVRVQSWVSRLDGAKRGVIRSFDNTSVFIGARKVEIFASVEELAEVWGAHRPTKFG